MNKSTIVLILLLLLPVVSAQLRVFHTLNQISADGGATSIDPDGDGQINGTFIENGNLWVLEAGNVTLGVNAAVLVGRSTPLGRLMINASTFTGAPLYLVGERLTTPGAGNDDNSTYLFIRDATGNEAWGVQAQDDGDFGIHESGRTTPLLIKANTGKIGINLTDAASTDPVTSLHVQGVITATRFAGDGSLLENLTSASSSLSCATETTAGSGTITATCSSGTMTGGGGTCGGSAFLGVQPSGNGFQAVCPGAGTAYVRCCSIV